MQSLYRNITVLAMALTAVGRPLIASSVIQGSAHKRAIHARVAPARVFVRDRSALQAPVGCCLAIPAGKTLSRSLDVVNHDPAGTQLLVRAQPVLVQNPRARRPLPAIA